MSAGVRRRIEIRARRLWHAYRGRLAAVVVLLPVLAVMVHSAVAGREPRAQSPSRAAVCHAAGRAAEDIAARFPDTPPETLDAIQEQACTNDPAPAPTSEPSAVSFPPGCHLLSDTDRRSPVRVRAAEPARSVPFFAARSGRLPRTGAPRVGGIQLPAGSRCGPFWSTDAGVAGSVELARALAAIFPSTGLWPVIWSWSGEEPDTYVQGGGDLSRVDSLDAETVLRRAWRANGAETRPFPGLAAAEPDAERQAMNPFGHILEASLSAPPPGGPILMLVPVNRPADVIAVLGFENTIYFSDEELSAVLRSWEERFGAVLTAISPGGVELVVATPPSDDDRLDRLIAEHATFAPDLWTEADLQRPLRSSRTMRGTTSARYWTFGWPD